MRLVVCVLACVGAGEMALALADPPATSAAATATAAPSAAQPAATPAAATPATAASAAAPAAKAATPTVDVDADRDQLEKHFLAEGYKLEMHNGDKYFCRREETLGTHLGGQKVCGTAQQLQATEREAQAAYQRGQTQQVNPSGH
jgi:pyruvate/2-oxoglutarate dehydrogenase complex dihydrolipoamide acyltransferase (E2) component